MSGLVFACCSAGRPDLLVKKTLKTLARGGFTGPLWLVVPEDEMVVYQQAVAGNAVVCMIVTSERGLVKQRKKFRSTMLPGTEIVFVDDDVEAIKILTGHRLVHCTNVVSLANYIFEVMAERGDDCLLAGIYPVCNRDWLRASITENNSYVVGALYFCKNDERLKEPDEDELEDWNRCLSEQAAGRPVLRHNWIGIQTQYWKNAGGLQATRTDAKRLEIVEKYAAEFYGLVKLVMRKNGKPDLKYVAKPKPTILTLPAHLQANAISSGT
jgi:hypothetical protein